MKSLNMILKKGLSGLKTKSEDRESSGVFAIQKREWIEFYGACYILFFILGLLFYRNVFASLILGLCCVFLKKYYLEYKKNRKKEKILDEFRDVLYSVSGSVAAGRQMPAAVEDARLLCESLHGEKSEMTILLSNVSDSYENSHANIEDMFWDFGMACELDEIMQFAGSCRVCRQCGGNIEDVCLKSAKLLLDRIEFRNEVKGMIAEKKMDIILLTSMPLLILLFLNLTNYSYVSVLYSGALGRIVMTLCLGMIVAALLWGMRIADIKQ